MKSLEDFADELEGTKESIDEGGITYLCFKSLTEREKDLFLETFQQSYRTEISNVQGSSPENPRYKAEVYGNE